MRNFLTCTDHTVLLG